MNKETIYKCYLLTITKDIKINTNKTIQENISNAKVESKKLILVQPTNNPNFFKEIISEKLIPVYRIAEKKSFLSEYKTNYEYTIPKTPYFIKYTEKINYNNEIITTLKEAKLEEIQSYIDINAATKERYYKFINELNNIIETSNRIYYNATKDSESEKIKSLIRHLKNKIKSYE